MKPRQFAEEVGIKASLVEVEGLGASAKTRKPATNICAKQKAKTEKTKGHITRGLIYALSSSTVVVRSTTIVC